MPTSAEIQYHRRNCLKGLFQEARKKNCFYKRKERSNKEFAWTFATDIIHLLNKRDYRFLDKFQIGTINSFTFEIFHEITIGNENPSLYLFKAGKLQANISLEAETKQIWRNITTVADNVSFFNAHMLLLVLYRNLSNVLKGYAKGDIWKTHKKKLGLHSIELRDATRMTIFINNFNSRKLRKLIIHWVPTIKIPQFALPYARQWFGENIPCLVAKKSRVIAGSPELIWIASYHKFENAAMECFPATVTQETFYGSLIFANSDPALKLLPRNIMYHVFFEITNHIVRWLDSNYRDHQELTERDSDSMMEYLFTDLKQKLVSNFVPNYFNPEFDLLRMSDLSSSMIGDIIHRLTVILRGNCDCCMIKLKKNIHTLAKKNKQVKKLKPFRF